MNLNSININFCPSNLVYLATVVIFMTISLILATEGAMLDFYVLLGKKAFILNFFFFSSLNWMLLPSLSLAAVLHMTRPSSVPAAALLPSVKPALLGQSPWQQSWVVPFVLTGVFPPQKTFSPSLFAFLILYNIFFLHILCKGAGRLAVWLHCIFWEGVTNIFYVFM